MDDWATRYPTLVDDIGRVLESLAGRRPSRGPFSTPDEPSRIVLDKPLPPRLNFSSQKLYTKYSIALLFASLLGSSASSAKDHLVAIKNGPGPGETVRPRDCHLSNAKLEALGVDTTATDFEEWWSRELSSK